MATFIGSADPDSLTGSATDDAISGLDGNDTLLGLSGNDTIAGDLGNDSLDGGDGFDLASYATALAAVNVNLGVSTAQATGGGGTDILASIEGLEGSGFNDTLTGNGAANSLVGLGGNDLLLGGLGSDTYLLEIDTGVDSIVETGRTVIDLGDTLQLGAGLSAADITVRGEFRKANSFDSEHYDLIIAIAGTGNSVRLMDQLNPGLPGQVELLRFADGSTIDLTAGLDMRGTSGSETFIGSLLGDTYHLQDAIGADQISERGTTLGVIDTLQLGAGLSAADITVRGEFRKANSFDSEHYDLIIAIAGTGNSVRLMDQLNPGLPGQVELLRFADGSTIDLTAGLDMRGTSGSETFIGSLLGDTYHLQDAIGADQISERGTTLGVIDTLQLGAGLSAADITVRGEFRKANSFDSEHYDLIIAIAGTGNSVRLMDQLNPGLPGQVELLRFADGSTIDLTAGLDMRGTSGSETFIGSLLGDTYHLQDAIGADQISERGTTLGVIDTLQLGAGLSAADITVRGEFRKANSFDSEHYDLIIAIAGTGNSVRLMDQLNPGLPGQVELLRFADGSTIDLTAGLDMRGTSGSETFIGSLLGDTYHLQDAIGADQISERGTTLGVIDTLQLGAGLSAADITVRGEFRKANSFDSEHYDLIIAIAGTGNSVRLMDQLNPGLPGQVELLRFADGSTIDLTAGLDMRGTSGSETFIGSLLGDTYHLQDAIGADQISERGTTLGVIDTLQLGAGLSAADITVRGEFRKANSFDSEHYDLIIAIAGTGNSVRLMDQLNPGLPGQVELLRFADGSTIDLTAGLDMRGTSGSETFIGSLLGDTYHLQDAIGADQISERGTTLGVIDTLQLGAGLSAADITVRGEFRKANSFDSEHYDLIIAIAGTGNSVRLMDQLNPGLPGQVELLRFADGSTIDLTLGLTMIGTALADAIYGTLYDDDISADSGNDLVDGRDGNDTLDGGAGDDSIEGGAGDDSINGGAGTADRASYAGATGAVTVDLGIATPQSTGGAGLDLLRNIEGLQGSAFGDSLTGNAVANILDGGAGADSMVGGLGADTYYVDDAADLVVEINNTLSGLFIGLNLASAIDRVFASVNYVLTSFVENLSLTGGVAPLTGIGNGLDNVINGNGGNNRLLALAGNDNALGGEGNDTLDGGDGDDYLAGDLGFDSIMGGIGNDTLRGGENADTLLGADGDDFLDAGKGMDSLEGGNGNDTLVGAQGSDTLVGGAGNDLADYSGSTDGVTLSLALATPQLVSVASGTDTLGQIENLTGSMFDDLLSGDGNANVLLGGLGNDSLDGGAGVDILNGGVGNDTMTGGLDGDALDGDTGFDVLDGGLGNDVLSGGLNADTINGGIGDDFLSGGKGMDNLNGGEGNDTLVGGLGADMLTGGAGIDHFVFKHALDGNINVDTISDYTPGVDVIELSASIYGLWSEQIGIKIGSNGNLVYSGSNGVLAYDADGPGPAAAMTLAVIGSFTHPAGVGNDFLIVA